MFPSPRGSSQNTSLAFTQPGTPALSVSPVGCLRPAAIFPALFGLLVLGLLVGQSARAAAALQTLNKKKKEKLRKS